MPPEPSSQESPPQGDPRAPLGSPDGSAQTLPLSANDLSGLEFGDYKLERLLGRGGMGEVYLAHQKSLDRPVAIKILKPELVSNPTHRARFESEAWSAARLNHPNIVHIYNVGTDHDLHYIVMEYVQGTNLREYLARKGTPDLPLALAIMRQSAQAVGAAGEIGLVHRDIKPENLLLTKKGQVKVADFGLARTPASDKLALTALGTTLGTPMYMSPEQVQGHAIDHRSDLYSLGVTFYHMLAGVPPFSADSPLALALKHVRDTPVDLGVHRPDLPTDLTRLVMKLLEKDPANRFQTAGELLKEITRVREVIQTAGKLAPTGEVTLPAPAQSAVDAQDHLPATRPLSGIQRVAQSLHSGRIPASLWITLSLVSLLAGGALGYFQRAPDLLARTAPRSNQPPGLTIAPWLLIPKQPSPDAQYRYAQIRAPLHERRAAWLAVPGRFPDALEWASRAYIQLARQLLREGDHQALLLLAAELEAYLPESSPHALRWAALAKTARAAAAAIQNDPEAVVTQFQYQTDFDRLEPELAELCLEVLARARNAPGNRTPQFNSTLARLWSELARSLQLESLPAGPDASP
jgi:serine/threonine-protein kinase